MLTPYTNRPKVTQTDILNGYVTRYFVRNISTKVITEVDKKQYEAFKPNTLYETLELQWIITGFANNIISTDGQIIYGAKHKNAVTICFYERRMPGLTRLFGGLSCPPVDINPKLLEYFQGTMNKEPVTPINKPKYNSSTLGGRTFGSEIVPSPNAPNTEIPADYWWRADSGLTTSSWTASNGGLDFTFTNVTTASSAVGAVFNGTNGFGQTPVLTSNISATHVLVRLDSLIISTDDALLGGTQNNIHEIAHNASGFWNIVDATNASVRYGARTTTNIISPMPKVLWFDFETGTNAVNVYTDDNSSIKASMARYTGTYNNLFTWLSGYSMYLGRRQQVSGAAGYMRVNVKELAIFTSSLSYAEVDAFRTEMLARWP